jgi:hypothetical protein
MSHVWVRLKVGGLVFLSLFFLSRIAQADWDWRAGAAGRSLPIGAAAMAEIGYGHPLWGESGPGKFLYGFVRPFIRYQGVGLANRGDIGLDINPISFLNFRFGLRSRYRILGNFDTLGCETANCRGLLTSPFAGSRVLFGWKGLFLMGTVVAEQLKHTDSSRRFAEEMSSLYGAAMGDTLVSTDLAAGFEVRPSWSIGGVFQTNRMLQYGSSNYFGGGFVRHQWDEWSGLVGLGYYESSTKNPGGGLAFFQVEYRGTPSLLLN